jgi:hypothetical protein
MGLSFHSLYTPDGLAVARSDAPWGGIATATYAAAGAGVASTVAVSWTEPMPTPYCAIVSPVEDCTWFLSNRTALGFTLNVSPRLAANSLAGGTVKILVYA